MFRVPHSLARRQIAAFLTAATLLAASVVSPTLAAGSPARFVDDLWPEAQARGVKRAVFEASLKGFEPVSKVLDLTRKQPEFAQTVGTYIGKRITDTQVATGRKMRGEWSQTLGKVSGHYGVQSEVVLAIWGMETNFGSYMGGNNTVQALATLTYGGYRSTYFRNELLTALQILSDGHVSPSQMVGSWAGAMGHTQFMPSSFMRYAVDFNRDGRADIWNSVPDALASTANYLESHGWRSGETWGYEVKLPRGFDFKRAWSVDRAAVSDWQRMGVSRANGQPFPRPGDSARLYMPSGGNGPVFLLLPNFDVIKRYNNSDSYALAVGHLADRILGGGAFAAAWPANDAALTRGQRVELQKALMKRGYETGGADGVLGSRSRAAIMAFQSRSGLLADGHASGALLAKLR